VSGLDRGPLPARHDDLVRAHTPGTSEHEQHLVDPFPVWRELRDHAPLWWNPVTRVWMLTRYRDVVAVFADPETYSNRVYEASVGKVFGTTMLQMDGHEHVVRRSIIAPEVVGRRLDGYRDVITGNAQRLIDAVRARPDHVEGFDLVDTVATWLPVNVICDMLGLPVDDLPFFHDCYRAMMVGLGRDPSLRAEGVAAAQRFKAYCAPVVAERRARPGGDFVSRILISQVDGRTLDDEEVGAFLALLLTAGGETTDKAIGNLWANLLAQPDLLAEAAADPTLLDAAFSETMRHSFPIIGQVRLVTRDVEWYGVTVPAGAVVHISIGSANDDDAVFAEPRRFDPRRRDLWLAKELRRGVDDGGRVGHLGFGLGKHFCLGYEMARAEAVMTSEALLEAFPRLHATGPIPPMRIDGQARGIPSLPVAP
jgi:pulcherriminic acid synthase